MSWRRAGLADLVHVAHELEHLAAFAGNINQRLAAAERSLCFREEPKDERLGVFHVRLAVFLFLRPAGSGHEEQFGFRANRLLIGLRGINTFYRRSQVCLAEDGRKCLNGSIAALRRISWMRSGIDNQYPGTLRACDVGRHSLTVEPAPNNDAIVF